MSDLFLHIIILPFSDLLMIIIIITKYAIFNEFGLVLSDRPPPLSPKNIYLSRKVYMYSACDTLFFI